MKYIVLLLVLLVSCVVATNLSVPRWAAKLKNKAEAKVFALENDVKYIGHMAGYYIFEGNMALKRLNLLQKMKSIGAIRQVERKYVLKKRLNDNFLFIK